MMEVMNWCDSSILSVWCLRYWKREPFSWYSSTIHNSVWLSFEFHTGEEFGGGGGGGGGIICMQHMRYTKAIVMQAY